MRGAEITAAASAASYAECSGLCGSRDACQNFTYECPAEAGTSTRGMLAAGATATATARQGDGGCALPDVCVAGVASTVGWLTQNGGVLGCGEIWKQAIADNCGPSSRNSNSNLPTFINSAHSV